MRSTTANRQSLPRLFVVGIALPAALVASDDVLLSLASHDDKASAYFSIWLVAQTALMSFAAGTWLRNWFWRLVVLGWTLLLLNTLLFDKSMFRLWEDQLFDGQVLPFAFVSAQFSLSVAWLILGGGHWQWRVPAALVPALPAGFLFEELQRNEDWAGDIWNEITVLQAVVVVVLALAVRYHGARIASVAEAPSDGGDLGISTASQFSLIHLLVWTAVIAPFLLLWQTLDYVFPHVYGGPQWGLMFVYAALLAPVALTSFWAALGTGRLWLRVAVLAFVAAALGLALRTVESRLGTTRGWVPAFGRPVWVDGAYVTKLSDAGLSWLVWTELSGFLSVGMLLVLRVKSYRLVIRGRPLRN